MEFHFETDYRLEDYILNTTWESLPDEIQNRAKVCAIDLMIALLLGSQGQQFQAGLRMANEHFQKGTIPVIGSRDTFGLLGATVAMSHASNSFDIDDGHNMIKGHPGTSFVAGVLAAALEKDISYKEYLTALVVSYEATVRCGLALQDHYQYLHSTGAYGAFGTAAGMARVLGFTREELNTALSIAEFHAPLTPVMRSVQHPSMNKDGVPFGALVGAAAVLESRAGSTGYGYLLELPQYKAMVDSLGNCYEIMNLYFKPYTCCRWAHQPISACIDLKKKYGFRPEDIEHVYVHTFDSAAQLSKRIPTTTDEAQYNIAWPVASALVFGDVGIDQVIESALGNQEVLNMMDRLTFDIDLEMEAQFPAKRLAWVEVRLKNQDILKSEVYTAPGEHTDQVDLKWIANKFRLRTAPVLEAEKQEILLYLLENSLELSMCQIVETTNLYLNQ